QPWGLAACNEVPVDLTSEGGHDDPSASSRLPHNLRPVRQSPQGMWSSDFVRILEKFLHSRWWSVGVESTIYGNQPRAEAGIDPCGTVWVAKPGVYYSSRTGQWLSDHYY